MNKTILVTGIGGNVGQGILRNIIQYDSVMTDKCAYKGSIHLPINKNRTFHWP